MLAAAIATLKQGKSLRVTTELQALAYAAIKIPDGFDKFLSYDALVYGIKAERLDRCFGNGSSFEQYYLVLLALAHMEWDKGRRYAVGLNEILPLFIADDFEATMTCLKSAHAALDTSLLKHRRICVFCAPTPEGCVTGQTARAGARVLKTLRERGLFMTDARYCADDHTAAIDESTTFGSICNTRRAVGIRRFVGRSRAVVL